MTRLLIDRNHCIPQGQERSAKRCLDASEHAILCEFAIDALGHVTPFVCGFLEKGKKKSFGIVSASSRS
jgi:hypothetical protein